MAPELERAEDAITEARREVSKYKFCALAPPLITRRSALCACAASEYHSSTLPHARPARGKHRLMRHGAPIERSVA